MPVPEGRARGSSRDSSRGAWTRSPRRKRWTRAALRRHHATAASCVSRDCRGIQRSRRSGSRGTVTGKQLWENIKNIDCKKYYSDYWRPYKAFLPKFKHIQSKAETYTVEGTNNLIRHYIARFKRKTHCYSKSVEMINNTLLLFSYRDLLMSLLR